MKKYINTLSVILFALAFTSCDSYLDENPDDRQEIGSLENLQELLVSGYSEAAYNFIEWKTDNAVAITDNNQLPWLNENFQFKPVISSESQDSPTYFWSTTYNAIAHANQALDALEKVPNTDKDLKRAIRGEALILRAYNHFLIANIFSQHYDPTTAATNFGIPYITAPETQLLATYKRGTLQETYDKIENDLNQGLLALYGDAGKGIPIDGSAPFEKYFIGSKKYHFNKNAAYAFASRFYLYKKNYEECIRFSNKILGGGTISNTYTRDMQSVFVGTSLAQIGDQFSSVDLASNFLVVRKETLTVTRAARGYRANNALFNQIFSTIQAGADHRDLRYWSGTEARYQPKYNERFRFTTSTTGRPYYIQPELRAEETIFNRMESYVMTGRSADALADYNIFAQSRYAAGGQLTLANVTAFYSGTEQEAMMAFIIDERRKEFLREGLRWWDVKRFKLPVTHIDITGDTYELAAEDPKKAVQLPEGAIIQGIEANPR